MRYCPPRAGRGMCASVSGAIAADRNVPLRLDRFGREGDSRRFAQFIERARAGLGLCSRFRQRLCRGDESGSAAFARLSGSRKHACAHGRQGFCGFSGILPYLSRRARLPGRAHAPANPRGPCKTGAAGPAHLLRDAHSASFLPCRGSFLSSERLYFVFAGGLCRLETA